ncbi:MULTISPECIES: TetR/AcrR family transcriptional regulator [unclassified Rathayibacter]|uniref:TetR/AcrR family transcriptional regulator n=1 Tax=unclassified Rathayibacter TaxID=2609250 RepID=UPI0006F4DA15|nr:MULTISPECIES: TetR/AcrR family transcriptional regulator [unclassified Rathayibacter]KQQ01289.1 hypothetical protein ASF42_12405 [Rathayibacter sp. Leaf294]KQS11320.1 hypothetical protein ASG06_12405 [Rathayibacter sp. Leaf185]
MDEEAGRRGRKRAQTRHRINEAALRLFVSRGYDSVTVADVAEEADIALTTLFAHFPEGKQSLVFGSGEDRAAALSRAIVDRPDDQDVLDAAEAFIGQRGPAALPGSHSGDLVELIRATPALIDYARRRWVDCESALAETLRSEVDFDSPLAARSLARFILEAPQIAGATSEPGRALTEIFDHLRRGWIA